MFRKRTAYGEMVLAATFALGVGLSDVDAACVTEGGAAKAGEAGLILHLSPTCTQVERETHIVRGERITDALERGHPVDLIGVIIQGDVLFDRLTPQAISRSSMGAESSSQSGPARSQEQRLVRAGLRLRDSIVQGAVRHRSGSSTLWFEGPIDFQGSRFKEGVDLSWSGFRGAVELSGAVFEKEAYFVQGQFVGPLVCRETRFGPSTRFHRSTFRSAVDCTGALFDGMAEFLEVLAEQPVEFERSRFGLGTGFSGSRFKSRIGFRDAIFSRETFFTFTVFEGETMFAGAQFLGAVDFSNAEFRQQDNLTQARFDHPPLFAQTKRIEQAQPDSFLQAKNGQYVLTFGLLVTAALLVAYAIRLK
ncbi:MAG: pentapeptide repeat-containing protein [Nitrospira sp.]|nr:pentapeptide repeat-containing protein [Nitrospira sp.]